jgi:thiosulfate/3-mercaptopyruvate sulfurtransferase
VLTAASELRTRLATGDPITVLDVRWRLGGPPGRELYDQGHVPGAVFVDLDTELAAPATAAGGRHPLPALADLQAAARRWGVRADRPVVVADDTGGLAAARAWWLLRWAGLPSVTLLDGGLVAWEAAGGRLETADVVPAPSEVVLTGGGMPTVTADDLAELATDGVLLDARAAERFRGEVEPIDPRAGHVPGARSAPTAGNLTAAGTFEAPEALGARFAALGVQPGTRVAVYCGSGVTAAHEIAALALVGIDAALYPGSWSQWSADPDRPVATGAA